MDANIGNNLDIAEHYLNCQVRRNRINKTNSIQAKKAKGTPTYMCESTHAHIHSQDIH